MHLKQEIIILITSLATHMAINKDINQISNRAHTCYHVNWGPFHLFIDLRVKPEHALHQANELRSKTMWAFK